MERSGSDVWCHGLVVNEGVTGWLYFVVVRRVGLRWWR